jgi:uncharacterized protein YjeT (DUF2065 family)
VTERQAFAWAEHLQRRLRCGANPEATLRRFGTRQLILPVAVPVAEAGELSANASYRLEGVLEYTTPGAWAELLFENDLRRPSVSFRGEGQLDQPKGG